MDGLFRGIKNLFIQIFVVITAFWVRGTPRRARAFQWGAARPALVVGLLSSFIAVPLWGLAILGNWSYWYPVVLTLFAITFILIAYNKLANVLEALWSAFIWVLRMFGLGIGRMFGSIFSYRDPACYTAMTIVFLIGTTVGQSLLSVSRDLAIILYSIGLIFGGVGAIMYLVFYWRRNPPEIQDGKIVEVSKASYLLYSWKRDPLMVQGGKLAMITLGIIMLVIGGLLHTFTALHGNLALIYIGAAGIIELIGVIVFLARENSYSVAGSGYQRL